MENYYLQKRMVAENQTGTSRVPHLFRNLSLTHTVTHTRKKAGGVNGQESAREYELPQQKGPESAE